MAYVAICWLIHHRLFSHARVVTDRLVWANIALLWIKPGSRIDSLFLRWHGSALG